MAIPGVPTPADFRFWAAPDSGILDDPDVSTEDASESRGDAHGVLAALLDEIADARRPATDADREATIATSIGNAESLETIVPGRSSGTGAAASSGGLAAPLPTYTNAQIGSYLETGFWSWFGGGPREFNIGASGTGANNGTLYYNVSGLTSSGISLADKALVLYEQILGLDFVKTTSSGDEVDIFFYDDNSGAYANSVKYSGTNFIDFSYINISTAWLSTYGTATGTYSFQSYLHEIGHALGLGHAGAYNGTVNFVTDTTDPNYGNNSNVYLNDSWQASIMSYISQSQNTIIDGSYAYLISPMVADWIALGNMYGTSSNAFSGSTTWGFNTNITSTIFANLATYADENGFTIIDGNGIDTVDFSGFSASQVINLAAGAVSNIGGRIGNMVIAANTVIENARGGSGGDAITGNSVANSLYGYIGNDTLRGGSGNDSLYGDAGSDTMHGDQGNDAYYVGATSDVVIESTSGTAGGTDTVYALTGFVLSANVEALALTGTTAANATGNTLNNNISGNSYVNTIRGLAGIDTILSGNGADIVIGGTGYDVFRFQTVVGSNPAARDTLRSGDGAVAFENAGGSMGDRFDLSLVDANTNTSVVEDFIFGTTTGIGRLWALNSGTNTLIRGNTDGDVAAEFEIAVEDAMVVASAYSVADFIL